MHIALVISSLQSGGAERVLSGLANTWAKQGHEISLLTLSPPRCLPFYPLDPLVQLYQLNQLSEPEDSFIIRFRKIIQRILTLRKHLKKLNPDVIISFIDIMNIMTFLAGRGLNIPIVVCERTHPAYHPLPLFYQQIRRLTYRWADKVIFQTSSASSYFSTVTPSKKKIIPNGVIRPLYVKNQEDLSKPVQQIISIGRLCPYKGFDILIRAFSKIIAQNPDLKLVIYGEGSERPNLESLILELGLQGSITLPGLTHSIEKVLCQADLFVFPSLYEGFPNALCEAMAAGLPVIASNCSGNIDIIRDSIDGRLFQAGNVKELTSLMKELVQDFSQRVKLAQGALTLPDRFSESHIHTLWEAVLAEVKKNRE